jgi:hypothetical protein
LRSRSARAPRRSRARQPAGRSFPGAEPEIGAYRLTVRHESDVERERFESLDEAIAALRRRAEAIRAEGGLPAVSMIRTYEPERRVHARLELSAGGLLRRRDAGVDVMGNGRLVPYAGGIRRRELEPANGASPFDAVREALA